MSGGYFPASLPLPLTFCQFCHVLPVFVVLEGNSVGTNFLQGVLDDDGPLGLIGGHGMTWNDMATGTERLELLKTRQTRPCPASLYSTS